MVILQGYLRIILARSQIYMDSNPSGFSFSKPSTLAGNSAPNQQSVFSFNASNQTYPPSTLFPNVINPPQQQLPQKPVSSSFYPPSNNAQQYIGISSSPNQVPAFLNSSPYQPQSMLSPTTNVSSANSFIPPVQTNFIPQQQPFNFNQQYQQQPNFSFLPQTQYNYGNPFGAGNIATSIRLLKEKEPNKKVVAVIVSFRSHATYDQLFTQVQQKTMEGTQVLVYACNSQAVKALIQAFQNVEIPPSFKGDDTGKKALQIVAHSKQVDPDCTVFNWQCSMGYSNETFPEGSDKIMDFLKIILNKGHMAMFSDFSLKALINNWDEAILGKNPFKRTGAISGPATLKFKPSVLKQCPSSQLQLLGDLVQAGKCVIQCAGNTILYTVDKQSIDPRYVLQILTIHISNQNLPPAHTHEIDGQSGDAGHVLLRYPSGGMILTSMGHWIQLMKIDPSEKKLFEVAQREFGVQYAQQIQQQYNQINPAARNQWLSSNAKIFVQNQAPCSNMNRKGF